MCHSSRHVSQLLSCVTVAVMCHSCRRVSQLPSCVTVAVMCHSCHRVSHLPSCVTVAVMCHSCRHVSQLPSCITVAVYHVQLTVSALLHSRQGGLAETSSPPSALVSTARTCQRQNWTSAREVAGACSCEHARVECDCVSHCCGLVW